MAWCSLRVVGYHRHKHHGYVWAPYRRTLSFHTAKAELQAPLGRQCSPAELPVLSQHCPSSRLLRPLAERGWTRGWRAALTCTAARLCCRQITDSQNKANKPCLELGSALFLQMLLWRSSAWFWQSGLGTQALKNYELTDFLVCCSAGWQLPLPHSPPPDGSLLTVQLRETKAQCSVQ